MDRVTLAEALDDYLRIIVRTHPWRKRREEEALTGFAEWLERTPGEAPMLSDRTPDAARRYAVAAGLDDGARRSLLLALENLMRWARAEGPEATAGPR